MQPIHSYSDTRGAYCKPCAQPISAETARLLTATATATATAYSNPQTQPMNRLGTTPGHSMRNEQGTLMVTPSLSFVEVVKSSQLGASFDEIDKKISDKQKEIEVMHHEAREARERALDESGSQEQVAEAVRQARALEDQAVALDNELKALKEQYTPDRSLSLEERKAQKQALDKGINQVSDLVENIRAFRKDSEYQTNFATELPDARFDENGKKIKGRDEKIEKYNMLGYFGYKPEVLDKRRSSLRDISNSLVSRAYSLRAELDEKCKKGAHRRTPCFSVVFSEVTGEYYSDTNFKLKRKKNKNSYIKDLHPVIQDRLKTYQAHIASMKKLNSKGLAFEVPGTHSEVRAISRALRAMDEAGFNTKDNSDEAMKSLHIFNMRVLSPEEANRDGINIRRCNNCKVLTQGANCISDVEGYIRTLDNYKEWYQSRHKGKTPPLQLISPAQAQGGSYLSAVDALDLDMLDFDALDYDSNLGYTLDGDEPFTGVAGFSDDEGAVKISIASGAQEGLTEIRDSAKGTVDAISYHAGVPHGERTVTDSDGRQVLSEQYGYGVLLSSTAYDAQGNVTDQYDIDHESDDYQIYSHWRAIESKQGSESL